MKVVSVSDGSIREAARILSSGGLVISPTDSVYGLFCSALDENAVARVKEVKGRDAAKPLQVAVRMEDAEKYGVITPEARKVIGRFWPGDVNIIVTKKPGIPDSVSKDTVCLTCHANPAAGRLVELSGKPLVSTSANFSGDAPPKDSGEINPILVKMVDLVLEAGETKNKKPNTIVDLTQKTARIVRDGPVSGKSILEII